MENQDETAETIAVRRTRREKKKSGASSALEKIKRGREMGVVEESELEKTEDVFEYVDEAEYAKIVQQRQEEGFVLDDDGSYCEHGREIFDEEVDTPTSAKDKGKGRKKFAPPGRRVAKPSGDIKHMVMSMGEPGKKRRKEESASVKDDNLLSDLLKEIKDKPSTGGGRMSRPHHVTPSRAGSSFTPRLSSTPQGTRSVKKLKVVKSETRPPRPVKRDPSPLPEREDAYDMEGVGTECADVEDVGRDSVMREEGENGGDPVTVVKEEIEEVKDEKMTINVPEEAVSVTGWETVRGDLKQGNAEAFAGVQLGSSSLPTTEVEGEPLLLFYWLDAYEDPYHQPGSVFLFGKVWVEDVQSFVSCCVVVRNISRCLYFLPREKLLSKSGQITDQDVKMEDLYAEFSEKFANRHQILKFTSKRVMKKYAFELPDVPSECEYLEVKYSCEYPAPSMDDKGRSYSRVFGTNTSCLERMILYCKLRGPSWLNIKQPSVPPQNISWCKCEAVVLDMDHITVATEQAPPPPLVVMSLSVKITLNPKSGTNEVLCLGSLVHPDIRFDKPPPDKPFQADLCAIRHPVDRDFPFRFDQFVQKKGFNVEISASERAMLAYFLAKLHRADPDIIVGHNLSGFALEVLQHRMSACKVPQWSRIGRLKRKDMPRGRSTGHLLCAGRPVCDVKVSSKELIRAKSYDLPELASTILGTPHQPMEHEDVLKAFSSCEALSGVIAHTMEEAMLSLKLMYDLNALALAYQITCLAGNTLSRTLHGGRAERNELLLLHAFTAKNFICPDKAPYGKKNHVTLEVDEEEGGAGAVTKTGRRKPAYAGGLVLEPKRGFYDRFILLLDFNSLYPSIMQEYNVCFTTIDHAHCSQGDDGYSKLRLPDPSEPAGVLPSEIRVLVERRRQVKKLMKDAKGNKELYTQYDIRQKALKLTANSMYGCLGFSHSRFHAQPLAAIITGKGREILANTKELAQKLNLDVIYGDTDSIMIDSNTRDLQEAEKIAQRVKTEVNKLYKLLEIDVDGIYKAMLLLRKKKYAAVAVEIRDGVITERTELKGLDIVRRDWCELAKKCGHYVISLILSGQQMEKVIESIQTHLAKLAEEVNSGKTPLQEFVITKSLTKPPSDYPDKKGLPHVQVALRMLSRNLLVQAGDVIPYVMCKGESNTSAALRAYHPDEVSKQDHLEVDTKYYLQHQVHAVVSRLCEPIEGLGPASIAEFLGLDPSGYRTVVRSGDVIDGMGGGSEGREKVDPFEGVVLPVVNCTHCKENVEIQGSKCKDPVKGLNCSHCQGSLPSAWVVNHLTQVIRKHIRRYYAGWLVCEDQTCSYRTRHPTIALIDSSPKCPNCKLGKLREEFPASALYRQLVALDLLFTLSDTEKVNDETKNVYKKVKDHIQSYLSKNQYSIIDLSRLFPSS